MRLSRFSDYSLRVLMFAALKNESFQIDEVTEAYQLSRHHVAKIVHQLAGLGYLETRRGRGGGTSLAHDPVEISLGKLLRQTERQSPLVECFDPGTNTCNISSCCKLKGILARAEEAFFRSLDEQSLRDLVSGAQCAKMRRILLPGAN